MGWPISTSRLAASARQSPPPRTRSTKNPNDIEAHELLGKVYLRSLGDMQSPQSGQMLQLAIAEYEKLAQLKPNDVETHLLLGQLYGLNHDSAKAEAQFKARAEDRRQLGRGRAQHGASLQRAG